MFRMCSIIEKMTKDRKNAHSTLLGHSTVYIHVCVMYESRLGMQLFRALRVRANVKRRHHVCRCNVR